MQFHPPWLAGVLVYLRRRSNLARDGASACLLPDVGDEIAMAGTLAKERLPFREDVSKRRLAVLAARKTLLPTIFPLTSNHERPMMALHGDPRARFVVDDVADTLRIPDPPFPGAILFGALIICGWRNTGLLMIDAGASTIQSARYRDARTTPEASHERPTRWRFPAPYRHYTITVKSQSEDG